MHARDSQWPTQTGALRWNFEALTQVGPRNSHRFDGLGLLVAAGQLEDAPAVLDRGLEDLHGAKVDFAKLAALHITDLHPLLADDHHVAKTEHEMIDAVPVARRLLGLVVVAGLHAGDLSGALFRLGPG